MKRAGTLSALACLLAVTGSAPAAPALPAGPGRHSDRPQPAAGSLLDAVPQRGVLRVCTTGDYPPYTSRSHRTGAYRGVDISMARDLARSLDATPRFVRTSWEKLVPHLSSGRCDIAVGGVSVTLERARRVAFSEPTHEDGKTPIVRCADKDRYRTLRQIDRKGTTVVVNSGGTNEEFARQHIKRATIREHPDNTTVFDQLVRGHADVMMTDAGETRYQAKRHPQLCSVHPDKPFNFAEKAYALPRGDAEFREYVDQFVHLAVHDGTFRTYEDAWMR